MLKILIVEDDRFISAVFSCFIKGLNYTLTGRCTSGREAFEACEKLKPDIVLMDVHLEGELDGIQTAEIIQKDFEVPVIFISSDTSSEIIERAIIANSYGYLVKPVTKKELGITIELAYYKHKLYIQQKLFESGFRKYISEAPLPVVIIDSKGGIMYLNVKALDLFSLHYIEDVIGSSFIEFVSKKDKDLLLDRLNRGLDTDNSLMFTVNTLSNKEVNVKCYSSTLDFNGVTASQLWLIEC
ncbi:response regulator [Marinilabiliaceae bacterium ANBcel2]|nr:response regulator [Marinilabiliaceae bacterium ANBcel2]